MTMLLGLLVYNMFPAAADTSTSVVSQVHVQLQDTFWKPRLEINRNITLPHNFKMCEQTGRIRNFAIAGGLEEGDFEGIPFNDSDVFKIMEGAAYILAEKHDEALDQYLDDLIYKIAQAQEDDGYLYTARTIMQSGLLDMCGEERWSNLVSSHELYNIGHMYEAAAAHFEATGKRNFLDIALKNAELILKEFGPGKRQNPPGHQEIELGLIRLYEVTGDVRYLELAQFFIDARGVAQERELYGSYSQDHQPISAQSEAVGHAVRAVYYYASIAGMARFTDSEVYRDAMDRIWDNVVSKKIYLTGGIGSRHHGEAFGDAYELPNKTAYNETCAAIGNVFWNWQMFLLHQDAKYIDILERILYNGFLSGVDMNGVRYFYPNPLESDGEWAFNFGAAERLPWFDCSCCPVNVVRFLPQVPGYFYAVKNQDVFVNLYGANQADITIDGTPVIVAQTTHYPWDGDISLKIQTEMPVEFTLHLRIPGWALDKPVPSDLYHYQNTLGTEPMPLPVIKINGEPVDAQVIQGYARIQRKWENGDEVLLSLPFEPRLVRAHEEVVDNQHRFAIERGPLVYCVEGADNEGSVLNKISHSLQFHHTIKPDMWAGVTKIIFHGYEPVDLEDAGSEDGSQAHAVLLQAIPYYAWGHRGANEMLVWIKDTWSIQQDQFPIQ